MTNKKQFCNLNDPTDVETVTNMIFADDEDILFDESETDEEERISVREDNSESEMNCESAAEDEDDGSTNAYITHLKKKQKNFCFMDLAEETKKEE